MGMLPYYRTNCLGRLHIYQMADMSGRLLKWRVTDILSAETKSILIVS